MLSATTPRPKGGRIRAAAKASGSEDGQALVEFALVLPMVLVLLFGIAWFGIALNDWIDETQLVSQAARFAAVNNEHGTGEIKEPGNPKNEFLDWIRKQGDNAQVQGATATMCSPTSKVGDYVEVKLTYMYKWLPILGEGAESPITSTAQMRIEAAPSTPYPTKC